MTFMPRSCASLQKCRKSSSGAEHRVDAGIVIRVVPVCRPGHEDRVEVEHLDTEIMQIIQLFAHAGEIAAEKVVICDLAAFVRLPDGDVVRVAVIQ